MLSATDICGMIKLSTGIYHILAQVNVPYTFLGLNSPHQMGTHLFDKACLIFFPVVLQLFIILLNLYHCNHISTSSIPCKTWPASFCLFFSAWVANYHRVPLNASHTDQAKSLRCINLFRDSQHIYLFIQYYCNNKYHTVGPPYPSFQH